MISPALNSPPKNSVRPTRTVSLRSEAELGSGVLLGPDRRNTMPELKLQNFRITYRHAGQSWPTVQQAFDRDTAIRIFKRDNPHVEFETCDDGDGPNAEHHARPEAKRKDVA